MNTAAPNVNTVTLVGQLTSDPVVRALSDGRNVCDLRLAVNDQPPLFIDIATFGPGADACARYLTTGAGRWPSSLAASTTRSGRRMASNAPSIR
jgi:hypothetical protein